MRQSKGTWAFFQWNIKHLIVWVHQVILFPGTMRNAVILEIDRFGNPYHIWVTTGY
jgi:hypothetical protein